MENTSDFTRTSYNQNNTALQEEEENTSAATATFADMNLTDLKQEMSKINQLEAENHKQVIENIGQIGQKFLTPSTQSVLQSIGELLKSNQTTTENIDDTAIDPIQYEDIKRDHKFGQYASKLKFYMRFYSNINEQMLGEIKKMKNELLTSQDSIDTYKVEEIQQLESKIKKYADQLKNMTKKHPWINDADLHLENIHAEVMKLESMKQQHAELKAQLNSYKGLKSDLTEARMQLALHKTQFEKLSSTYN